MGDEVLDRRTLNRALLARQLLLARHDLAIPAALEHLVGLQAQSPNPPYLALWSRLQHFDPHALGALLESRQAVRTVVMRGTLHLVTADDALTLRPLTQPVIERQLQGNHGKALAGIDPVALVAAGRALLADGPVHNVELGRRLAEHFPGHEPADLAIGLRAHLAMVQVPPRGVWGKSGPPTLAPLDTWLGRPLAAEPSVDEVVLRYLAAFGPASARDAQTWSGLTRLGEVLDRIRPRLVTFRDERGVELFDLPDAPRPDPTTPAPVRFLPEFDNLTLSHHDRSRVVAHEHRPLFAARNGMVPGTVLVDGFAAAMWRTTRSRRVATLTVAPFTRLTTRARQSVRAEGRRLLALTDPAAHERRVDITDC